MVALAAFLVGRGAGVGAGDQLRFAGYVLGWLVLPGTLAWRAVRGPEAARPLVEDLAVGALVGYVLEFPAYLFCLAVGHPRMYLAWPVVAVLATVTHRRGRALWVTPVTGVPLWWSWTTSALLGYVIVWFGHWVWGPSPVTADALRSAYVDEPFHLSLIGELRHHFPADVPYVAGARLRYHVLSHVHMAAASWVSGVEPIVLLRTLAIPTAFAVCVLAAAAVAVRVTGSAWTGPVTVVALLLAPADFSGWVPGASEGLLELRLLHSPTAGFVNAALLLGVLLCLERLRGRLAGWPVLALTWVCFVAMAGAKSTSLPTVGAGLVAATVVCSLAERRVHRQAALLAALTVTAFVVAQQVFFAGSTGGLRVQPLALLSYYGSPFPGLFDGRELMPWAASVVAMSALVGMLALGVGLAGLLSDRGWREPGSVFLVVLCASGLGAGLVFHQGSFSEFYFVCVVFLPLGLGAVLGLHRVVARLAGTAPRLLVAGGLTAFGTAAVAAAILAVLTQRVDPDGSTPVAGAIRVFAVPAAVVLVLAVLLTALLVAVLGRVTGRRRLLVFPVAVLVFAGLGAVRAERGLPDLVSDPVPQAQIGREVIGPGGIAAARWLRAHSGPDDLTATNAHCQFPTRRPPRCQTRNFWIAGYAERRVLVEGWAYTSRRAAGHQAPPNEDLVGGPFWDPATLRANDAAFTDPTAGNLHRLRDHYGVRWLFVDPRYPADVTRLRSQAKTAFERDGYVVLSL